MRTSMNLIAFALFATLSIPSSFAGAAFIASSAVCYRGPHSRECYAGRSIPLLVAVVADVASADDESRSDDTETSRLNLGLLRGVDLAIDKFYADEIDMTKEGLAWLDQRFLMWEEAKKDADAMGIPVKEYMDNVLTNIDAFQKSGVVYDREELTEILNRAFIGQASFALLLGGKNVGKSTVLKSLARANNLRASSKTLVLYVDARSYYGRIDDALANELARLTSQELTGTPGTTNWVELVESLAHLGRDAAANAAMSLIPTTVPDEQKKIFNSTLRAIVGNIYDSVVNRNMGSAAKVSKSLVDKFIDIAGGRKPVLIIDEVNVVLGMGTNAQGGNQTLSILTDLVKRTKQDGTLNVILASSEHGYPYRLQREGFNLLNVGKRIFAGEIPPKDMWKLLVSATNEGTDDGKLIIGMGPHLAKLCIAAYGGSFWNVKLAIDMLSSGQEESPASDFVPELTNEIIDCLKKRMTRPLLEAMAKYGFALIDSADNPAAELISEKNVGGVVARTAVCIGLPRTKWDESDKKFAIIPSSQCVRLRIAQVLSTRPTLFQRINKALGR